MITVYKANNSIEAKLIQDALEHEGIIGHIMGGLLEGGAGELLPQGLVSIMTYEQDAKKAKQIIRDWEKKVIEPTHLEEEYPDKEHNEKE